MLGRVPLRRAGATFESLSPGQSLGIPRIIWEKRAKSTLSQSCRMPAGLLHHKEIMSRLMGIVASSCHSKGGWIAERLMSGFISHALRYPAMALKSTIPAPTPTAAPTTTQTA
jgi:hypothetical protein